jgi:hypothetical protein
MHEIVQHHRRAVAPLTTQNCGGSFVSVHRLAPPTRLRLLDWLIKSAYAVASDARYAGLHRRVAVGISRATAAISRLKAES